MGTEENKRQKAILDYLRLSRGIFCWRQNNHATFDGKTWRRHTGMPGIPDIVGIMDDGRFLGIEVKSMKGVQSKAQKVFQSECDKRTAVYILARNVDDVMKALADE